MLDVFIPLSDLEKRILRIVFDADINTAYHSYHASHSIVENCVNAGNREEEADESILCLVDRGLLSEVAPGHVRLTNAGFDEACTLFIPNYDDLTEKVGLHLLTVNDEESAVVQSIASSLGQPFLITYHFIDFFRKLGWVKIHREDSEYAYIVYISPLLNRALHR